MSNNVWLLIITFIIAFFTIYLLRIGNQYDQIKKKNRIDTLNKQQLLDQNKTLKENNEYLQKIKFADENIFDYIRCINIPRTPGCRTVDDNTSAICRSRQIDCNKMRLVLENDPIAVERMKIATDRYTESNKEKNPSDLTYPVRSGWFF